MPLAAATAAPALVHKVLARWANFKRRTSPAFASYAQYLPIRYSRKLTVKKLEDFGFPRAEDLWDGVLIAVLLTALRLVLEYAVLRPFGRWCMQQKYHKLAAKSPVPLIDATLRVNKVPMLHEKQKLAKA